MALGRSPSTLTMALLLLSTALIAMVRAADEDPLQDLCVALNSTQQQELNINFNGLACKPSNMLQSSDFTSTMLRHPAMTTAGLGVAVNLASASTFGALNTQGLSIARIDLDPKGLNPPHVHPRATEVLYLAQGTMVVGFVSTAPNNTLFQQTLYAGDLFVFPRGLVHFQINPDKSQKAVAISALNSQNPGVSQLAAALFAANPPLPEQVLEITLGIDKEELYSLISSVKKTLA